MIESNATPAYDKAQALRLYAEQSEMDALVQEDTDRYKEALEATGGEFGGIEPISRFHEAFQGPVDVAYAAAVVGLETETLQAKIRENLGLQDIGLLVLAGEDGSMKRDAWTSSFRDVVFALDFPEHFKPPKVITPPIVVPGEVVRISDPNLRAAIAEELGKSPNAPITAEEMKRLRELRVADRGIRDLTGLQFATNMYRLHIGEGRRGNQVSDLSPIAGLINLERLYLASNPISDISLLKGLTNLKGLVLERTLVSDLSPLKGLTNLEALWMDDTIVSDLSPIARLINLKNLRFHDSLVSDLSPLAGLINLENLTFAHRGLSDISSLAGLVNLKGIFSWDHSISDLSPLAGLTKLERIDFCGGNISDLTPLAGLTGLKELYLGGEEVSDVSPLAGLTGLTRLGLHHNDISDISPIAGLTNLKWLRISDNDISDVSPIVGLTNLTWLAVDRNNISDLSPLDGLRENIKLIWHGNPAFPADAPKIEGPWLWVVLPGTEEHDLNEIDWLSEASGGKVTEVGIATHGATEGKSVGDSVWISHRLPPTGWNNIEDMLKRHIPDGVIYGSVFLHSPREQETTMYVGGDRGVRVYLNGTLMYQHSHGLDDEDYTDFFPATLQQGRNVLLVAVHTRGNGFFGFELGTEYTVLNPGVGYTFSKTPIHIGDTFTLDISAENVFDLAAWQFNIVFDPTTLEAVNVSEGDFLKTGGSTFFQGGSIDNAAGKITGLNAVRLATQGVTGTGSLLQVNFKAKSGGETELALQNFQFGSVTGDSIPAGPHEITIAVEGQLATGDVNRDGQVTALDLILVSQQLGEKVPAGSPVDVNGDGVVTTLDLLLVSQAIGNTTASAAPTVATDNIDAATVEAWIAQARLEDDGSLAFKQGIENLERLLASLIPEETALLHNYPNPFNPETWIPYQLAESAEVTLTIYDMNGHLVRRLAVGYQAAGMYRSRSRAAYWNGRNQLGESVASGLYFYTLTAGEFTATRRMLILK